jgi:chorismate mutase
MDIKRSRKLLDKIDNEIVSLLAKRLEVAKKIGEYKFKHGIEIFQPNREEVIKERLAKFSAEHDIDSHFLSTIWNYLMSESIKAQEKVFEEMKSKNTD